jgi:hypothetical protein
MTASGTGSARARLRRKEDAQHLGDARQAHGALKAVQAQLGSMPDLHQRVELRVVERVERRREERGITRRDWLRIPRT